MQNHSRRVALPLVHTLAASAGLLATGALGACAPSFENARTPSGQYCTDMPIYLNNQPEPDRPFHRLKPIATPMAQLTAPERLEALRRATCDLGGDAVINAGDEEAQTTDHIVIVRASGYAVRWTGPVIRSISSRPSAGAATIGAASGIGGAPASAPAPAVQGTVVEDAGDTADGEASGPAKAPAVAPKKKLAR